MIMNKRNLARVPHVAAMAIAIGLLFTPAGIALAHDTGPAHFVLDSGGFLTEQVNQTKPETAMETTMSEEIDRVLSGPYFLRSADPEPLGVLEFKFIYAFETYDEEDDEHEGEFELEWGIAENIEFLLATSAVLGDGLVEGNGDITVLGLHTRFWEEDGWIPAFAMRNQVRLPTGYHSSGVDYTARGLFTWTLIPEVSRLHFNPFVTSINGDNYEEDEDEDFEGIRRFRWGAAIGADCMAVEDVIFTAAYKVQSSELKGDRDSHSMEIGMDWEFAEGQELGLAWEFSLDGDTAGPDFIARISYILEIQAY
jgi:hypothetical protein